MSNENKELMTVSKYGEIVYANSVFSAIATNVIDEFDNIEVAESSKLFKADKISTVTDGKLSISIPVRVNFKSNVTDLCNQVQAKIFESIDYMTDYKPESITVQVVGFIF